MKKRLAILGSTGSIGTKALEVIDQHPELFTVEILSAHTNADLIIEQARKYKPNAVVITQEEAFEKVKKELSSLPIKVFLGQEALMIRSSNRSGFCVGYPKRSCANGLIKPISHTSGHTLPIA